jgi:predicted transcriptional regulator
MLSQLFGSHARVKILKIFLFDPDKKYYIRQLARDLKLQVNSVRRELENLENFGLLSSQVETGDDGKGQDKKFFKVNRNFVLFDELKSLIIKSQILHSQDFVKELKKICDPKLLVLTGVFTNNRQSQTDIFLVAKVNRGMLKKLIDDFQDLLGREINYTVMDLKEFKYRKDITDVFLYSILDNPKLVIIDDIKGGK